MTKLTLSLALASVLSISCFAVPALALSPTTFVSGKGADTGNCASPASPCRTFQYAFSRTSTGGEIKALDPANYSPVTIARSVSITGVEGASITRGSTGAAITISAGANDSVNLRGLTIDGFNKTATNGILFLSGGSIEIVNCVVRRFSGIGIYLASTRGPYRFSIKDTFASDNTNYGVVIQPGGSVTVKGLIEHMTADRNGTGVLVSGLLTTGIVQTTIVDSAISSNATYGVYADSSAGSANTMLFLDQVSVAHNNNSGFNAVHQSYSVIRHSTFTNVGNDVQIWSPAIVRTTGDNYIPYVNGGTLQPVGLN